MHKKNYSTEHSSLVMTTAWGFFELLLGLRCWGWLVRGGCSHLAKMQRCPPCRAGSPAVPFPQTTRQWDTRTWSVPARVYQQDGGELHVAVPTPMNKCLGISVEQTCRTKSVTMFWYTSQYLQRGFCPLRYVPSSCCQRKHICPLIIPVLLLTISHSQKGHSNNRHQVYSFHLVRGK